MFDPAWYLQTYPECWPRHCRTTSRRPCWPGTWSMGKSWGIPPTSSSTNHGTGNAYPAVGAMVREGRMRRRRSTPIAAAASARSPHWLFDERYYRRRYPDLTDEVLQAEPAWSMATTTSCATARPRAASAIRCSTRSYFCDALEPEAAVRRAERGTVPLLSAAHRVARAGTAHHAVFRSRLVPAHNIRRSRRTWRPAAGAARCTTTCATTRRPTFDPLPEFSEQFYLARNPASRKRCSAASGATVTRIS